MKYFLLALMLIGAVVTVRGAKPEAVATPKTVATPKSAARSIGGVRFSDVQLKTSVRLRYAEQGNPKGEAVILLHWYSDSWFSYSRILPLIDKEYHVYVPDQRGHGDSDRPVSGLYGAKTHRFSLPQRGFTYVAPLGHQKK